MGRLLIVNPFASGVDEHRLAAVRAALPEGTETRITTAAGEAIELARGVSDLEALYVLGGDGTYNEVLNGLEQDVPLGLLPGGGTSVLPRALGLPLDPEAAARQLADALAERRTRRITIGSVNGRRVVERPHVEARVERLGVRRLARPAQRAAGDGHLAVR